MEKTTGRTQTLSCPEMSCYFNLISSQSVFCSFKNPVAEEMEKETNMSRAFPRGQVLTLHRYGAGQTMGAATARVGAHR